jgi:hypothetical protein
MFGLMGESYVGTCCTLSEEWYFVTSFVEVHTFVNRCKIVEILHDSNFGLVEGE